MPRDGSLTLSDIRAPTLAIGYERCGRHGRYSVARLIAAHGADAKLTGLLVTLANCEKARVQHLRSMQGEVRGLQLPSLVRTRGRGGLSGRPFAESGAEHR
jgi:hypothetical protein